MGGRLDSGIDTYALFDRDGTGGITPDELEQVFSHEKVKVLMDGVDADHNGYIDSKEFQSTMIQEQRSTWVIFAKNGTTDEELKQLCSRFKTCLLTGHPNRGGIPFFSVGTTVHELNKTLSPLHEVDFVEVDTLVTPDAEDEVEAMQSRSWGLDRVGVPSRFAAGAGAHIYVLDSGIRVTHNDFGGRAIPAIDLTSNYLVKCEPSDADCAGDTAGHGTHCAGTAAGTTFGVASQALVYAVKVLSDSGPGDVSWMLSALDWITTDASRPAIASMSLGHAGALRAWRVTIDLATQAGVTVVVSAGNDDSDACTRSPAYVPSAITVGSTTIRDERSSFSGWGTCVKMWAPGSAIVSASQNGDDLSAVKWGSSMACPHVSGAAALYLSVNPNLTSVQVLAQLRDRAEKGAISDQQPGDENLLLWVGAGPAPVAAPTSPS